MRVRRARNSDLEQLAGMRAMLWPAGSIEEHRREAEEAVRRGMHGTLPMAILLA